MSDLILESTRVTILAGLLFYLVYAGRSRRELSRRGWKAILCGFGLLLFGSAIDITDNFDSLNRFVVIGDTEVEAVLEKLVGFLGGFTLLAYGLVRWIPTITTVERIKGLSDKLARANAQLHLSAQFKSEFLANMSHEIRTPMTAILGFSDLLLSPDSTESDKLNAINTIRRNGRHLLSVINDILDVSKIEAGKLAIESIPTPTRPLLRDVLDLLSNQAEKKGLRLIAEIDGSIPEQIQTDPTRLKQALVNLVGNAIKFTDQGTVRLIADSDRDAQQITLHVKDQGVGISQDRIDKIFQPFEQADASMTRRFGGTGLGLTITLSIAKLLGGEVKVTSERGVGSTFSITVPTGPLEGVRQVSEADPSPSPVESPMPAEPLPRVSGRVLLVEDGADNQRLISFMVKKAGADVTIAENGQVGYEQAMEAQESGQPFGVILLDMQMPVMDGYSAAKALRQDGYDGQIIALTAHAMKQDEARCLEAGCDHYLSKPINRDVLIREIASRMGAQSLKITPHGIE